MSQGIVHSATSYFNQATANKLTLVATIVAKEGKTEELKSFLLTLMEPTRAEKGCESYYLYQDTDAPSNFIFHETWSSVEDWNTHMQSAHLARFDAVKEGLVEEVTIEKYERSDATHVKSSDNGLVLFARIKALEGKEEALQARLESLIAPTMAEEGAEHYELHKNREAAGLFLFHETWTTVPNWDMHMVTPHLVAFLAEIDTWVDGGIAVTKAVIVA
ncbi:MAG: putative quinol monooxygenase [Phocaeicola sp.]